MSKHKMQKNNPSQRNLAQNNRGGEEKVKSDTPNKSLTPSAGDKGGRHTADR